MKKGLLAIGLFLGVLLIPCATAQAAPFLATFRTTSANEDVTLPLVSGYTYNFTVDWGDSSPISTITTYDDVDITHTYATAGDHQISVEGSLPYMSFYLSSAEDQIVSIDDDGDVGFGVNVTSFKDMFGGAENLTSVDLFDTSSATDMSYMFNGASSLTSVPLFDTSSAITVQEMFRDTAVTTVPLFDLSSASNMQGMFFGAASLTTVPLFSTSSVVNMSHLFQEASSLSSVPLFDTSSVTNMRDMFGGATSLTSVPLYDVSSVTNFLFIFAGVNNLSQGALSGTRYTIGYGNKNLDADAIRDIFNNLGTAAGSQTITITGNPGVDDLTQEDYAVALGKGWTVSPPFEACSSYSTTYVSNFYYYETDALSALPSANPGHFYYDCGNRAFQYGNVSSAFITPPAMGERLGTSSAIALINTNTTAVKNQTYYDEDNHQFKVGQTDGTLVDITAPTGKILDNAAILAVTTAKEGDYYYNTTNNSFYRGLANGTLDQIFTTN